MSLNFWANKTSQDSSIGLIAGQGDFPILFAKAAMSLGKKVTAFGVEGYTDRAIEDYVTQAHYFPLGGVEKLTGLLRENNIRAVVMAGSVPKKEIYNSSLEIDQAGKKLIEKTKNKGDDHLLRAFQVYLKVQCGVSIVDSRVFLKNTTAPKGVLTRRQPTRAEWEDLRFGWKIAKGIGRMDIGQTVVVKRGVVLVVEAIEGTDSAIKRGAALGQGEAVVVKVCKPNQDLRFDLPCVGRDTLENLRSVHSYVLGLEAHKTIMIFKDQLIETADKQNLTIVGM